MLHHIIAWHAMYMFHIKLQNKSFSLTWHLHPHVCPVVPLFIAFQRKKGVLSAQCRKDKQASNVNTLANENQSALLHSLSVAEQQRGMHALQRNSPAKQAQVRLAICDSSAGKGPANPACAGMQTARSRPCRVPPRPYEAWCQNTAAHMCNSLHAALPYCCQHAQDPDAHALSTQQRMHARPLGCPGLHAAERRACCCLVHAVPGAAVHPKDEAACACRSGCARPCVTRYA